MYDHKEYLRDIMPEIQAYIIKNECKHFIGEDYEYFRDVITLYAKQHNLIKSTLLLMENDMNEEAFILARSVINNYFWIGYLLNDDAKRNRLKEYHIQPLINERNKLSNMIKMLKGDFGEKAREKGVKFKFTSKDLYDRRKRIFKEIESRGFDKRINPVSVSTLAKKCDKQGFDLYSTFYVEASKYEHSDISSLEIYKQNNTNGLYKSNEFVMDLNRTNKELQSMIYSMLVMAYIDSCHKIIREMTSDMNIAYNYNEEKIKEIIIKTKRYIDDKYKEH